MAISTNLLLKNLSGHIGKQLVIKQRGGKTFITKYPNMKDRILSPKQLEVNEKMELANDHAKAILSKESLRMEAQVRLNVTRNKLYTALISEYFKAAKAVPEVPKVPEV